MKSNQPSRETSPRPPLAERMRPARLEAFVGQAHLLGEGRVLRTLVEGGTLRSLLLWGPPGTGKTTLARLYAQSADAAFSAFSAVTSGVRELRAVLETARTLRETEGRATLVFVDEIHRFSRSQQDALLPAVEEGLITLVGATTENPGFSVNDALLSRMRAIQLYALQPPEIEALLVRALQDEEHGLGTLGISSEPAVLAAIAHHAGGDARWALNALEVAVDRARQQGRSALSQEDAEEAMQRRALRYDKVGDNHYQIVSAFIKSMRGSDVDAALFYAIRMLEAGEDPLFVLRRMVIFASEDIGNADPQALQVALAAQASFQSVGLPEGVLPITQAVAYLATAPKSNAVLVAYGKARQDVLQHGDLPVPRHLVNASNRLMRDMGYGHGYRYPHNFEGNYIPEAYRPEPLQDHVYYEPSANGFEATLQERVRAWREATRKARKG